VEGDYGQTSAGAQRTFGRSQTLFELFELGVQMDADRLEGPGRGIALLARAETCRAADDRRQLGSSFNGTCGNDRAGDRPGARLLPIVAQDPGDVGLLGRIQILGGGKARTAHPHVERSVRLE